MTIFNDFVYTSKSPQPIHASISSKDPCLPTSFFDKTYLSLVYDLSKKIGATQNGTPISSTTVKIASFLHKNSHGAASELDSCRDDLLIAAYQGDLAQLKQLSSHQDHLILQDVEGRTPLILAAFQGHLEVVKYLLNKIPLQHIDDTDHEGHTALMLAIMQQKTEVAKLLLDRGADPSIQNFKGISPLMIAVEQDLPFLVENLLSNYLFPLDIDAQDNQGRTALCLSTNVLFGQCIENNIPHTISLLLQYGANPFIKDQSKESIWEKIFAKFEDQVIDTLIKKSSLDKHDEFYPPYFLLFLSLKHQRFSTFKTLSQKGFDPFYEDSHRMTPFLMLITSGRNKEVADILEKNPSSEQINHQTIEGKTALFLACEYNHTTLAICLMNLEKTLFLPDLSASTPLMKACENGNLDLVEFILKRFDHVDINSPNKKGETAFLLAAQNGHLSLLKYLSKHNPHYLSQNQNGETSLLLAIKNRHLPVAKYLLETVEEKNRAEYINRGDNTRHYPLTEAILNGDEELVRLILKLEADIKVSTENNLTPLGLTILKQDDGLFNTILSHIPKHRLSDHLNHQDKKGHSPIALAILNNNIKALAILLNLGADPYLKTHEKASPLLLATLYNNLEAVKMLLSHNSSDAARMRIYVNEKNHTGQSPLLLAIEQKNKLIVEMLLGKGGDIFTKNQKGSTPLLACCLMGDKDIFDLILKQIPESHLKEVLNERDMEGNTPLILACFGGHLEIVKELLRKKSNPWLCNQNQLTPLLTAIYHKHGDIVYELIKSIDKPLGSHFINQMSDLKKSAIHAACSNGFKSILKDLIDQGADLKTLDNYHSTPLLNLIVHLNDHYAKQAFKQITEEDKKLVLWWLKSTEKSDLEQKNSVGNSIVYEALKLGHTDILQLFIDKNISFSIPDKYLFSILSRFVSNDLRKLQAISNNPLLKANFKVVDKAGVSLLMLKVFQEEITSCQALLNLIRDKDYVNQESSDGSSALKIAIRKKNAPIIKLLLSFGAKVTTKGGESPLKVALKERDPRVCSILLKSVKEEDIPSLINDPELIFESFKTANHVMIRWLIDKKSCFNIMNADKETPLMIASFQGNLSIVEEILKTIPHKESHLNLTNKEGLSALSLALLGQHFHVASFLWQKGAQLIPKETRSVSELHSAIYVGHLPFVNKILHTSPVSVDLVDQNKETPLMIAARLNRYQIAEKLLEEKGDTALTNHKGQTALMIATEQGHLSMVRLIYKHLKRYQEINQQDNEGRTAVMIAASRGHKQLVDFFISKKAHLFLTDKTGASAWSLAADNNHLEIAELIFRFKDSLAFNQFKESKEEIFYTLLFKKEKITNSLSSDPEDRLKKIFWAAKNNLLYLVKDLCELDHTPLFFKNPSKDTLLSLAIKNHNPYMIHWIATKSYQLDPQKADEMLLFENDNHESALSLALEKGYHHLISHKDSKIQNKSALRNKEALFKACLNGDLERALDLLHMISPKELNQLDENQESILFMTVREGHQTFTSLLMGQQMDLFQLNKQNESLFFLATKHNHPQILKILLQKLEKTDPSKIRIILRQPNQEGYTPLMLAASRGHLACLRLLLLFTEDIEQKTPQTHLTALCLAAMNQQMESIPLLLEKGANPFCLDKTNRPLFLNLVEKNDLPLIQQMISSISPSLINTVNSEGESALFLAVKHNHFEMIELLIKLKPDPFLKNKQNQHILFVALSKNEDKTFEKLLHYCLEQDPRKTQQMIRSKPYDDKNLIQMAERLQGGKIHHLLQTIKSF
ncbi:MAG: ankyrin repeat domain-containing protein [Rhabdochlamydiaceae bacterium]